MIEKIVYKNKKGKIVRLINRWNETSYLLFNANGEFEKYLIPPFKVSDYL